MVNKHSNVDVALLLGGLAMLVAGLFWFFGSIVVTTGFFRIGGVSTGLVVIPMVIGVVLLFFDVRSLWGRILALGGLMLVVASVILGTRLHFRPTSLYAFVLMLVLAGGGAAFVVKALWGGKQ